MIDVCICGQLEKSMDFTRPSFENEHSRELKWTCEVHGKQQRYKLIHTTYNENCYPCKGIECICSKVSCDCPIHATD